MEKYQADVAIVGAGGTGLREYENLVVGLKADVEGLLTAEN